MMPEAADQRWQQRFDEYRNMLALFKATDANRRMRPLNDAEKAGLVQFFGMTLELGWKTLGLRLRTDGMDVSMAPMPVVRAALAVQFIADGDIWARAIKDRNIMARAYDVGPFDTLVATAGDLYTAMFDDLLARLTEASS